MKPFVRTEMPFKQFMMQEAERLGITKHALEMRRLRGLYTVPHAVRKGPSGRAICVIIATPQPA